MAASEIGGKGIPCVFGLLPNKKKETYGIFFNKIKEHVGEQNCPKTIISDFEQAVFSICAKVFPTVSHKGCRFHHNAAVWKNLGDHHLQELFNQNPRFQELIYLMYTLCYVPVDQVKSYYDEVIIPQVQEGVDHDQEWEDYDQEIDRFGYYYSQTWIEKRGGRRALFPPCLWNQYSTVLEDGMETNNMLESFNRTWNLLSGYSPNVWHIQDQFVKQDADARRAFLSNSVGQDMADNTGRKQRAKDAKQRVKLVVEAFATMPKTDYLKMLAHDLQRASAF